MVAAAVLLFCSQAGGAKNASAPLPLKKSGYVVWSPSCQMPDGDPYDVSIRAFLAPVKPIVCSDRKPLTFVTSLAQGHVLRVDESVKQQYVPQGYMLRCCYRSVSRPSPHGVRYAGQVDNHYK
ncbi:hypothetical protein R5R35_001206 [Gryllus longicercus]|uniref:Accessory gland protein n=1 Tax=Gryllus longicercus TaxID=2509291 RepID=A0AAN9VPF0_9ORTH